MNQLKVPLRTTRAASVADVLHDGGVALVPTDTVYGLAVLPQPAENVHKIYQMKQRPSSKNLPVMVAEISQLATLGAKISDQARPLLRSRWVPGPLSFIFGLDPKMAPTWLAGRDEIAIRIPAEDFLLDLLRLTGPLLVTSANISGRETPQCASDVLQQLADLPDVVVDLGPRNNPASTLLNCRNTPMTIQRAGAVSAQDIQAISNATG